MINKTREQWVNEAAKEISYIRSVNGNAPGENFNYSSEVFARYCNMQANKFANSGCWFAANEILTARDLAYPTYRSEHRAQGDEIIGTFAFDDRCEYRTLRERLRGNLSRMGE